jgi:hypothetical protein
MSRAIRLSLPEDKVATKCDQLGISVSTIETLDDGMTRLVCTTGKGAQEVRAKFRKFVLDNSHRAQSAFDHLRREENI